ncbi:MAG: FHA domain-containing protein [Planctomycetes bacterium]|nr:FHA domain-containing protein [Planctomycetota bacterium]
MPFSNQFDVPDDDDRSQGHASDPTHPAGELMRLNHTMDRVSEEALDLFFDACGGRQAITLAVRRIENRNDTEIYTLHQPFVVIGSCPECDLVLPDRSVNYRHVYLQLAAGQWYFANLARISRTKAGQGHPSSGALGVGDELKVGYNFIRRIRPEDPELVDGDDVDRSAEEKNEIIPFTVEDVSRRRRTPEVAPIEYSAAITLIGTSKYCGLVVADETASRVHASLVSTPKGLFAVDLLGRGGIIVNGRQEVWARVEDGGVLQIGKTSLRISIGSLSNRQIGRLGRRAVSRTTINPASASQSSNVVPFAGMSEGAVLALMGQITDMQNQFFEHSRLQMQWMTHMLTKVTDAQREQAERDFARIEEISREMSELRAQLARMPHAPAAHPPAPVPPPAAGPPSDQAGWKVVDTRSVPLESGLEGANGKRGTEAGTPRPPQAEGERSRPAAAEAGSRSGTTESRPHRESRPPERSPFAAKPSTDAPPPEKKRPAPPPLGPDPSIALTERMAKLSQEQNSLWRRLMKTFSGGAN